MKQILSTKLITLNEQIEIILNDFLNKYLI